MAALSSGRIARLWVNSCVRRDGVIVLWGSGRQADGAEAMGDLWLGGAIIWLLAGGLFALALAVCRKVPRRWGAIVGLARGADADPRYQRDWGWDPGREHAVLLYGFLPHELADMVDPGIGREKWRVEGLRVLWRGSGMRLVKR